MFEIGRRLIEGVWHTGSADESGGGGSQPFTLLGPYTVDWDSSNIGSGPHTLGAVTEGLLIVNAYAIVTDGWLMTVGTIGSWYIALASGAGAANLSVYEGVGAGGAALGSEPQDNGNGSHFYKMGAIVPAGATLTFEGYPDAGAFTAGQVKVYALAYDPAA